MTSLQRLLSTAGKPSMFGVDHLAAIWLASVSRIERLVLRVMLPFDASQDIQIT